MEIEWESNFETGNDIVDAQHRYFVDLINRVAINFRETDDGAYKDRLVSELRKYADFHFTSEENIATSYRLTGIAGHHQRHVELLEEFNHHAADLKNGQLTVDSFLDFLTDWFIGHTVYEDQKLFHSNFA
ncbi:MAG: hemerythrin family protein [Desulfobacterales bacterium]|nr:hemerythrin family protein [Desulfobacterales bacterium]